MTLSELAEALGAELVGPGGEAEVLGVSGLDDGAPGYITYAEDARRLKVAEAGPALAVIVPAHIEESEKPLLRVSNPRLAYASALSLLMPESELPVGVHPTAQIGEGVKLGAAVAIGAHSVIGDGSEIGDGTQIHPLVAVGRGVRLGDRCRIFPQVVLYDQVSLGSGVIVHAGTVIGSEGFGYAHDGEISVKVPHIGTVIIEDDVEIGANCTVDRGTTGATVIGSGTKIDNLVQIAHNVKIGKNCLLAAQVGLSGSVVLGDGVVMAGQAGIADHVTVGEKVIGGARAAIWRDVPPGTAVLGMPARPKGEQLRIDAAAAKLPHLVRAIRELERRLAEIESGLKDQGK